MNNAELLDAFRENRSNDHFLMGARDRRQSHWIDWTGTLHEADYLAGWNWMRDAEPLVGIVGPDPFPPSARESRCPLLYTIVEEIGAGNPYQLKRWDTVDLWTGFLEHAPASPGPLAPGLKGWSTPDLVTVCPTCAGRIMLPEGSEPLWFDPLTPCRLCLPSEVIHETATA